MSKRTPDEILDALDEEAADAEMDRVLAMSADERRREIQAAGADLGALHEKADALHDDARRSGVEQRARELEVEARVRSLRPSRSKLRVAILLAVAATIAIPAAAFVAQRYFRPRPSPPAPAPAPAPRPGPTPPELRDIAVHDCDRGYWRRCLDELDEVKRLDPAGDTAPAVQEARQRAAEALHPDARVPDKPTGP